LQAVANPSLFSSSEPSFNTFREPRNEVDRETLLELYKTQLDKVRAARLGILWLARLLTPHCALRRTRCPLC